MIPAYLGNYLMPNTASFLLKRGQPSTSIDINPTSQFSSYPSIAKDRSQCTEIPIKGTSTLVHTMVATISPYCSDPLNHYKLCPHFKLQYRNEAPGRVDFWSAAFSQPKIMYYWVRYLLSVQILGVWRIEERCRGLCMVLIATGDCSMPIVFPGQTWMWWTSTALYAASPTSLFPKKKKGVWIAQLFSKVPNFRLFRASAAVLDWG